MLAAISTARRAPKGLERTRGPSRTSAMRPAVIASGSRVMAGMLVVSIALHRRRSGKIHLRHHSRPRLDRRGNLGRSRCRSLEDILGFHPSACSRSASLAGRSYRLDSHPLSDSSSTPQEHSCVPIRHLVQGDRDSKPGNQQDMSHPTGLLG